jgi:hypothetical protein
MWRKLPRGKVSKILSMPVIPIKGKTGSQYATLMNSSLWTYCQNVIFWRHLACSVTLSSLFLSLQWWQNWISRDFWSTNVGWEEVIRSQGTWLLQEVLNPPWRERGDNWTESKEQAQFEPVLLCVSLEQDSTLLSASAVPLTKQSHCQLPLHRRYPVFWLFGSNTLV